ncbi:glutamyl-tRNA reductase [Aeoliella mucimassa]|uniref:Glutamyl-tRNA reductase n=1 Tax=Aeoliella mucimassa TaxID=2527972 RepID=A0A518AWB6_9BACT|nr:glutamyl-tRNA reductase [Aeoliella mucimassa]QDU59023.1 Glutamyl-tRNA reductase [Aeoliella mucimassa]
MNLRMVGCSHHKTSIAIREQLAFTPTEAADALTAWHQAHPGVEAVLLSTCNRTEFYAAGLDGAPAPTDSALAEYLAAFHSIPVDQVASELVSLDGRAVVEHLFRVAASLDSMVVGEPQILAQVKSAYELACELGSAGPHMHGCFQAALRVARRVASETALHRHRVSIPSVAIADFASRIFERFDDKEVLVIGAGEMADETLRYLRDSGARRFTILNRDHKRAESLAATWNGKAATWGELHQQLIQADLVISTTAAGHPIVTLDYYRQQIINQRKQRPLFILDLAMPRDFEPTIGDELATYLYSIDDLAAACDQNRKNRQREMPKAERIIGEETARFLTDTRMQVSSPLIVQLRDEWDVVKQAELTRLMNKLGDVDEVTREEITRFADRLVNKLLHPPMKSLRDEAESDNHSSLLDALRRLFQLKE